MRPLNAPPSGRPPLQPLTLPSTQSLAPDRLVSFLSSPQATYRVGPTSPWTCMAEQSQQAWICVTDPLCVSSVSMEYQAPAAPTFYPFLRNPRQSSSSMSSCCSSSSFANKLVSMRWSQVTSTRIKNQKWISSGGLRLSGPAASHHAWLPIGFTTPFARDTHQP